MSLIRQAIVTKYFGPGNVRGSRIKATASAGSVTVSYDCSLNTDANHAAAAKALATKFAWVGSWVGGGMPEGNGNVFVCVETDRMGKQRSCAPNYGFEPSFVVEALAMSTLTPEYQSAIAIHNHALRTYALALDAYGTHAIDEAAFRVARHAMSRADAAFDVAYAKASGWDVRS